jgi:dihydroorotase-like cyclic amidohydrolase
MTRTHEEPSADLSALLDVLKAAVQREDVIADRLDGKTRQLLALVGVLFAIVQTVAFGSFRQGAIGTHERVAIIALGFAAIGLLALAALASFRQQAALRVADLSLERAAALIKEAALAGTDVVAELCRDHITLLWSRRKANVARANRYQLTRLISSVAVMVITAELVVALASRIQ